MTTASDYSDVFVSYRRKDVEFVKGLVDALRAEGKEVWIDWEDIPPGSVGFSDDIKRGLDAADTFLCVLSPDYLESTYCVDLELGYAVKNNKKLIPIVLKKFDGYDIPSGIGHINWIYFTPHAGQQNTFEESFPRIVAAMETDLDHVRKHRNYHLRANEWDENERIPAFLLDGEEIDAAEEWLLNASGKDPIPTDLHKEYVNTSRITQNKIQARLRAGLFAGLVVFLILSIVAVWFGFEANRQRQIADTARDEAQALAQQVQALFLSDNARAAQQENDPVLALALMQRAIEHLDVPTKQLERDYANLVYEAGPRAGITATTGRGQVNKLSVSPNGEYIASATCDESGDVCVNPQVLMWDAETWEVRYSLDDITGQITAFAYDERVERLAVAMCSEMEDDQRCSLGTTIAIYNLGDGELLSAWDGHDLQITAIAFSHDGQQIATGSWDDTINVWNSQTGEWMMTLEGHAGDLSALAYSADDNILLSIACDSACDQGDLFMWDAVSGELMDTYEGVAHSQSPLVIMNMQNYAVFGSGDGSLILWNIERGRVRDMVRQHPNQINNMWLDEIEQNLVTTSLSRTIIIWEFSPEGTILPESSFGIANNDITGVGIVNQGMQLVTGLTTEPSVMVWDLFHGAIEETYPEINTATQTAVINAEGTLIALADSDAVISLLDFETGNILQQWETDQTSIWDIAFSPDGNTIVTGECNRTAEDNDFICEEGRVRIRNVEDGSTWSDLVGHDILTFRLAFSPDGQYLISMGADQSIIVWDVANATQIHTPEFENVNGIGFSADSSAFMIILDDAVTFWSIDDGSEVSRIDASTAPLASAAILPNGTQIAIVDEDGHVILYNMTTGEQVWRTLVTSTNNPHIIAMGDYIYTSERDQITVLDIDGNIIRNYQSPRRVSDISATENGLLLAAHDGGLQMWRVDTYEELLAWAGSNRYITSLSCTDLSNYLINSNCDEASTSE